jgi:hypothetical protein
MDDRLGEVALDIERHAASEGWDRPPKLYALVETADLLRREPQLAAELSSLRDGGLGAGGLGAGGLGAGGLGAGGLGAGGAAITPIDQGELPAHSSLEQLLGGIAWPDEVAGAAVAVERLMVPPSAERDMPQDEQEALRWLGEHPEREEVRIVVAVLRDGSRAAALRMRSHDDEQSVLTGPDLVPGLAAALAATLSD